MKKLVIGTLLTVIPVVIGLAFVLGHDTPPATAGVAADLHVELVVPTRPGGPAPLVGPIPPAGSSWHEIYPAFCATYTQDGYEDNGDGVVSACDRIRLNGVLYHIEWAGPTYWTTCSTTPGGPGPTVAFEPTQPSTGENPICQIWHEVYPNFCQQIHIDSWHDNGNGVLDVCDVVDNLTPEGPRYYHIDRIECNITIREVTTPVNPSTWSRIKGFIGGIL